MLQDSVAEKRWHQCAGRIVRRAAWLPVVSALLLAVLPGEASRAEKPQWVRTWASPMMKERSGKVFDKVTLRQVVRISAGGRAMRITFSNLFGTEPLVLHHVRVAQHGSGSAIQHGTQHDVHFQGKDTVTIPAGEAATSDAVRIALPALSELAISAYLPDAIHAITFHADAHRTSYVLAGDHTDVADLQGASTSHALYFLTGVDVDNAKSPGAVVTLGASITEGSIITADTNHAWPSVLAARLAAAGSDVAVLNMGISGNRLLADGGGESAEKRFDRDVLDQPGVRAVIFSDNPINDLGSTHPMPTAEQLIAGTKRLMERAHARGILFYCSTLTPFEGANYWAPEKEVEREKINEFIRGANSGCDGIVDADTASHDPEHPTRYLPSYDHGDHLHPNDSGHEAMGRAIDLHLFDTEKLSGKTR